MLTRESLKGIFAAVPIPWNEQGNFDEAIFREDVARLCDAGVHGIYTTGTTGEFYALNFDEFKSLVDAFAAETQTRKTLTQVGCTWIDNRGAADRAAYAAAKGVDGIQVALPFWMALTDKELIEFFKDIATASAGLPLVHYNTGRSKRLLGAREYSMILNEVPALIGTKFTGTDMSALAELLVKAPMLSHFVGEHILAPAVMLGGKGSYSSLALANPRLMARFYSSCEKGDWRAAAELERKIIRFFIEAASPLIAQGYTDAAIDKAMAATSGFLKCPPRVRKPYTAVPEEAVGELRKYLERNMPEFLSPS